MIVIFASTLPTVILLISSALMVEMVHKNIVINNRLKNKETEPLLQWYRYRLLHLHRLIGTKKSPASLQGFLKG